MSARTHIVCVCVAERFICSSVPRQTVHAAIFNLLENRGEMSGCRSIRAGKLGPAGASSAATAGLLRPSALWSNIDPVHLVRAQLLQSDDHEVINDTQIPKM